MLYRQKEIGTVLLEAIRTLTPDIVQQEFQVSDDYAKALKFSECLPPQLAENIMKTRLLNSDLIAEVLERAKDARIIYNGTGTNQ